MLGMHTKIVKYEKKMFYDPNKNYSEFEVLKEIEPTKNDYFENILKINGKLYKPCSAYGEFIAVEEIKINADPEVNVRCTDGLECPYCSFTDQDTHEYENNVGETECISCGSEIKYVLNPVINAIGECEELICHTAPIKLNEPITIE